jgi:filamin
MSEEEIWVRIQVKTFTRWANSYLDQRKLEIKDLRTDLSDGILDSRLLRAYILGFLLHALLEILGGDQIFPKVKRVNMKIQRVENINVSLKYIREKGIKLVSIGGEGTKSNYCCVTKFD